MVTATALEEELRRLAGSVLDPELPVLTLDELGVVRAVHVKGADSVEVELTPTYTGCPAVEAMSTDIERVLHERGIRDVSVRTVLSPAWSTDDISDEGRRKLREFGIAPPAVAVRGTRDAVPGRHPHRRRLRCRSAGAGADPLPDLRIGRHRAAQPLLVHRVQGTAPLPVLPRTVRPLQGVVMARFHPLPVARSTGSPTTPWP